MYDRKGCADKERQSLEAVVLFRLVVRVFVVMCIALLGYLRSYPACFLFFASCAKREAFGTVYTTIPKDKLLSFFVIHPPSLSYGDE